MMHIMFSKSIKEKLEKELKRAQAQNNAQVYKRVAVLLCYAMRWLMRRLSKSSGFVREQYTTGSLCLLSKGLDGL